MSLGRVTKYRAFSKATNMLWNDVSPVIKEGKLYSIITEFELDNNHKVVPLHTYEPISDEDVVLMQFTGMTDTYGRDIYERDILSNDIGLVRVGFEDALGLFFVEDDNYKMRLADHILENKEVRVVSMDVINE